MTLIYPVVLCGGSGTRLWPLSRQSMPKQFLNLIGENSLFQQAAQRVSGSQFANPLVLTSNEYRFIAAQQLTDINVKASGLLLEPSAKNTAPAIIAAAETLHRGDPDAVMLVMPSDHYIPDDKGFTDVVMAAKPSAENGAVITFGIQPDRPETGYGYIETGEVLPGTNGFFVSAFHEKPDEITAQKMLDAGTYLWNSGLFLVRCRTLLDLAARFVPDMLACVKQSVSETTTDLDFLRLGEAAWQDVEAESIDYAIMERADNLAVFPFSGLWSDLGDWQALRRELSSATDSADENGNLLVGTVSQIDSQSCLLWSDSPEQVVTAVGLKDTIIVAMKDAVLAIDATQTQSVKEVVDVLDQNNISQAHEQTRQFRPWGWFETLVLSEHYQVRRVHLYPRTQMSMQKHTQRSENWVVTSGLAEVDIDNRLIRLEKNQSLDIPAGTAHRLSNHADIPLTLIEVRTGDYLDDDDVERL